MRQLSFLFFLFSLLSCEKFTFDPATPVEETPGSGNTENPLCLASPDPLSSGFQSGDGTPGNPFTICTATQLNSIGDAYLDKSFKLLKDIDLTPIGFFNVIGSSNATRFSGNFDGDNFEISHLRLEDEATGYYGLIGVLDAGASVIDTNLVDVLIDTGGAGVDMFVGSLVAVSYGSVSGSSASGVIGASALAGGLVGSMEPGSSLSSSHSSVDVTVNPGSNMGRAGGLVGFVFNGDITDSYATGNVVADKKAGGLVASLESSGTPVEVRNCYATGAVTGVTGSSFAAGLIGEVYADAADIRIASSYATGDVSSDSNGAGFIALVGASGTVVIVESSFSTGDVYVETSDGGSGFSVADSLNVSEFYASGVVTFGGGATGIGGLLSTSDASNLFQDTYFNTTSTTNPDTTGMPIVGITGLSTAQMKLPGSYNFDFVTDWQINASQNNGFPFLR